MTQTSHTPGPWFDCPAIFSDCGYPSSIKAVRTGASVALIISDNPQDAHLIAAAPDLLAALEGMDEELSLWGADTIETMNLTARLAAIRAAIAKAKGE